MSDVFHVVKNKGTEDFKEDAIQRFVKHDYKVTSKANRMGMMLEGEKSKLFMKICRRIRLSKRNDTN